MDQQYQKPNHLLQVFEKCSATTNLFCQVRSAWFQV